MEIEYVVPGPVAEAFHQSDAFVRGLLGPLGSGKSSSCCWEILYRALEQQPDRWGRRRSKWVVVRNTYPELKNTTIKTWMEWFERSGRMKWDTPPVFTMKIPDIGDKTSLELEVIFMALDRPEEVGKLKSLELTGGWINEAVEVPKEIFEVLTGRVSRFPPKRDFDGMKLPRRVIDEEGNPVTEKGVPKYEKVIFNATDVDAPVPYWTGVIMDTNPPDDDHWWYKFAEEETPAGYEFFHQPGGLIESTEKGVRVYKNNKHAENVQNIPGGFEYYRRQMAGKSDDYIKVFLCAKYGSTMKGKPVYPEWNEKVHLSKEPLKPIPGRPIILAFDFGLTPACVAGQLDSKGRCIILKEWCGYDMGIRQFYSEVVRPDIFNEWKGFRFEAVGDPAGVTKAQTDERSCMEELASLGMACEPALTNDFLPRRDAVAYFMTRLSGGVAGFIIDPSCQLIRKGFNGGYRYDRLQVSGSAARYKDRPVKDKFSHPQDALQYLCMYLREEINPVRAVPVKRSGYAW